MSDDFIAEYFAEHTAGFDQELLEIIKGSYSPGGNVEALANQLFRELKEEIERRIPK